MSVIDLSAPNSTADGEFSGNITLKQTGSDPPGVYATFELAFPVDEDSAEVLENALPGASALFTRANIAAKEAEQAEALDGAAAGAEAGSKGTFGEVKVRVPHVDFRLTLGDTGHPDGHTKLVTDVEVRAIRLKATPKTKVFLARFQTGTLSSEEVATLCELMLADTISVDTQKRGQQVLPFTGVPGDVSQIGRVVSGVNDGVEYAGIFMGSAEDDDSGTMVEIDDFGASFLVPIGTIAGSIKVVGDGGDDLDDALKHYTNVAKDDSIDPTWADLVPALGRAYLNGGTASDEWPLTEAVMEDALKVAGKRASA